MTNQNTKTVLLVVASAAVTGLSIYLGYKRLLSSGAPVGSGALPTPGPADSTTVEPMAGRSGRPGIGDLRQKVHGLTGDLAGANRRVTGEGKQIVARLKLGKAGRRLPGFAPAPEAREPTMPLPVVSD